ncbi:MAG: polysaccharide deacetylase family protein [Clostridia bacterium]|nr:polysaccharide deacetylase family protein [Clostridia bacterium]
MSANCAQNDVHLIELLNKYGLKCTFNLNSELLGKGGCMPVATGKVAHYKLPPSDVRAVYEGHEVAAHTLTHPLLTKLDEAEIIRQVEQDRLNLSDLMGYEVIGMAYPCGGENNDDRVADIIQNHTGIRYARTIQNTDSFDVQENLYRFNPNVYHVLEYDRLMEMGRRFVELKPEKPQIFYIWGHAYEMDYHSDDWAKLEEFLKLIAGHDDIFYGTNREVLL